MAKIITATELAEIVTKLLTTNEIDGAGQFSEFMTSIADVVCHHCGGETNNPAAYDNLTPELAPDHPDNWSIAIHPNESLPPNGGVWANYDTDVAFINGEEVG